MNADSRRDGSTIPFRSSTSLLCSSVLVLAGCLTLAGCADLGDDPTGPEGPDGPLPGPGATPTLLELVPDRTVVGDTVRIRGRDLGAAPGALRVLFPLSAAKAGSAQVVAWSDEEAVVLVPEDAAAGPVVLDDEGDRSNELTFEVAPRLISFQDDLRAAGAPFQRQGCNSCHFDRASGNNGFSVASPADIRAGGLHGPAAVPRRSQESLVVRVVRGLAPDIPQMPLGGSSMPEEQIQLLEDWIDQGMRDN